MFGLISVITENDWNGYVWVVVVSSCLLVATLSFPIYALSKKLKKTENHKNHNYFLRAIKEKIITIKIERTIKTKLNMR